MSIDENGEKVVWYNYVLNRLILEGNNIFGKAWSQSYDNKGNHFNKKIAAKTETFSRRKFL